MSSRSVGVPPPTIHTLSFLSAMLLLLLVGAASAHEHWVDVTSFYPAVGETLEVYVCSGHHFPESDLALKDKVVEGLRVWTGEDDAGILNSVVREKMRAAKITIAGDGVHVIDLTLKRPGAKAPSYEAKAIVAVDSLADDPARYALGQGLELTPGEAVSTVRAGDTLSVRLTLEGAPLGGSLQVVPEDGRTCFIRTEPDKPGLIPIRTSGRYLVSAQVGARGTSLVFEVLEDRSPAKEEEGTK